MARIPVAPVFNTIRRMSINIVDDFLKPTVLLPPLYLHINPQNLQITFAKKINRTQTFSCYVEEYWGEELDTITCSNTTGGFISEDFGLDSLNRTHTTPYFKFQDIVDVYRNNANTYDNRGIIIKKGDIIINFHPETYFGFFESFDYIEIAGNPFRFTFNFTFKVEKSYSGI